MYVHALQWNTQLTYNSPFLRATFLKKKHLRERTNMGNVFQQFLDAADRNLHERQKGYKYIYHLYICATMPKWYVEYAETYFQ